MYYPERRIPLEWLALSAAILLLIAAIVYTPPTPALATGYVHVRVLSASAGQDHISLVFWTDSAMNLRVSGDLNANLGTIPPGADVVAVPTSQHKAALRVCFNTDDFNDCGIIRPIVVS